MTATRRSSTIAAKHVNLVDRVEPARPQPIPATLITITAGRNRPAGLWYEAVYVRRPVFSR